AVVTTVRRLRERLPGVDLEVEIAGDGPLLPPLRRLVEREGLGGWLHLPGRLSRAELARRYHRSHLYLSPARLESFGIAALEARTAGLPVAGLTGSGLTEFVTDGVSGVLADNDDQLLERVAGLLADRDRLARMAEHNRTHLPAQGWRAVGRATLGVDERAGVVQPAAARDCPDGPGRPRRAAAPRRRPGARPHRGGTASDLRRRPPGGGRGRAPVPGGAGPRPAPVPTG